MLQEGGGKTEKKKQKFSEMRVALIPQSKKQEKFQGSTCKNVRHLVF